MRLIRRDPDGSIRLTDYQDDETPDYAILSHTWLPDNQEVLFSDMVQGTAHEKIASYRKILFCVEQAAQDGLQHCWIDTCCIDKTSSAELQEAITAMFSWYRNSTKCYAYLSDVSVRQQDLNDIDQWQKAVRKSRWFTRGWTLQELLAPATVELFSTEGSFLGDKKSLEDIIHEVTKIPRQALRGADMSDFSVSDRLSWAEHRHTKRPEDKAYSLLGIFNLFIPLIYGEGKNAFVRLHEEIEKKHQQVARLQGLLSKLPVVQQAAFNSLPSQHRPTCLPGTRAELLREIQEWIEGPDSRCVFWLSGMAGTGKSTVARTVARTCLDRGILGASFFFSRGGGEVSRADKLFTTISWQLATNISQTTEPIAKVLSEQETIASQSLHDQWDRLILKPLSSLNGRTDPSKVVIVIDALDECDSERDIQVMLKLLATSKSLTAVQLRIFITCRPETSIRWGFSQIPAAERQAFVLHDILPAIINHDISLFFETELESIRQERGFQNDWPGQDVIRRLVHISGGLFIWASTACRFIREGRGFASRRLSTLIQGHLVGAGPEKQLDEIYTTVLKDSLPERYNADEKKEHYGLLRKVLGSIVITLSPLSIQSFSDLLARSCNEIKVALADLHTILRIPDHEDQPISLHHPTFRDFLCNENRCLDPDFRVDERQAHQAMATSCIELMMSKLRPNICRLESAGTMIHDVDPTQVKKIISRSLEYACRYWVQHYRESGASPRDGDFAHTFVNEHFLSWLEVMVFTGNAAEVAAIVRMYASLLTPEDNPEQLLFTQDARRFIFAFLSIIESAPLQTYCAALAFSQSGNELQRLFWPQMRPWLQDVRVIQATTNKSPRLKNKRTFFVNDLTFTPDGKQVVSGSVDEVVRVWDMGTKAKRGVFEGQVDKVSSVAISADGLMIASGSDDTTVMVWDFETRTIRHTLRGHSRWVNSVGFSSDRRLIASGSMDETIRIWDAETGEQVHVLAGNSSCINAVVFSPHRDLVAAASVDQMVRVWDIKRQEVMIMFDGHVGSVNCVQFSPEGNRIVSGADDRTVKIWDMESGVEFATLRGHKGRVMGVAYSLHARLIVSGSEDMTVILWDAIQGAIISTLPGHTSGINAISFSPDSRHVVSSSFNNEVKLWDTRTGEGLGTFPEFDEEDIPFLCEKMKALELQTIAADRKAPFGHLMPVTCIVASSDSQVVATGSTDATIKLWTRDGAERFRLEGHGDSIGCLSLLRHASLLVSASADKTVRIWSTETGSVKHVLTGHSGNILRIRPSPDDCLIASCSADNTIIIWHVDSGNALHRLEGHCGTVIDVAFSPLGSSLLASCSADMTMALWDLSTGTLQKVCRGHSDMVNAVSFSPDAASLVTASADGTLRRWDEFGNERGVFKGHTLSVHSAAFSPDSRLVVSCSDDESVRIWEVETQSVLETLKPGVVVRSSKFSDCGRYVETDRGILRANLPSRTPIPLPAPSCLLFASTSWLRNGEQNVLWIPEEYRATCMASTQNLAVLGDAEGGVVFINI